jgi:hypothetical protein
MCEAVKPGGTVLIWVYGREGNEWLLWALDPLRRHVLSRLPMRLLNAMSYVPAALLWALLRLGFAPGAYFKLLADMSFAHLRIIVLDQLLPRIANYWTHGEVLTLMTGAGLRSIRLDRVNGNSWAAIGIR